ncbi:hypothetical protein NC652_022414 [Populus alba x Populus x berolinensis]|nr:hypothetical protein NC652_022414 [Populus alba x Populus x berolinensis]
MIHLLVIEEIEEIVEKVASGLFCVLATLAVVPVIRCPSGGPAEMVASVLESEVERSFIVKEQFVYRRGGGDPFWVAKMGPWSFPEVAVEMRLKLNKNKKDVDEVNKETGGTDGAEFEGRT